MTLGPLDLITIWEWGIRIAAIILVPQRRAPAAARAWLLLILFQPTFGLILYLLIGRSSLPLWRRRLSQSLAHLRESPADHNDSDVTRFARALGAWPPSRHNGLTLHHDYDATIRHLIEDIDNATQQVDILAYIFASDEVGVAVADAIGRAEARGVVCRVLYDPIGSLRWRRQTRQLIAATGARYKQALPLRIARGFTRRDLRNHRKLYLVDGRIGWIGSQNIVTKDFRPGVINRELMVRAEGPLVSHMQQQFDIDWHLESDDPLPAAGPVCQPAGDRTAQLLPSGPDNPVEGFQSLLVWQLHRAQRRVVIVSPYFIPDTDLLGALRSAVLRGVEVHVLVSLIIDQPLVGLAQRSFYSELLRMGVRIHQFPHYLLHAKNLTIDEELAVVGSSNIDMRSFQLNLELSLLMLDKTSVCEVVALQNHWLAESRLLDQAEWARRPALVRVVENMARMFDSLV